MCTLGRQIMIRVVQRQRDGPFQRLAWDPGITGLGISLTDGGEWILAGENHFDFPLSFSFEGSMSLVGDSLRSCSTSLWRQHVQSEEAMLGLVWSWRSDSFLVEASVIFRRLLVLRSYRTILCTGHCSSHLDLGSRDWSAW
jgi:hypothetical protein